MVPPMLDYTGTGLKAGQAYEENIAEICAAEAGINNAVHSIAEGSMDWLDDTVSYSYSLPSLVNNLPVAVAVTRLSMIDGIIGDNEYKLGAPHEDWVDFSAPPASANRDYSQDWVEYTCNVSLDYNGTGDRRLESLGVFLCPFPGEEVLIDDPYDLNLTPVITLAGLDSIETKITSGGFAFIWRWQHDMGPAFTQIDNYGALEFKFKVHDADWEYSTYFAWATFKEQDLSYVSNVSTSKWLIEATAGDTRVASVVMKETAALNILTWEINPPD